MGFMNTFAKDALETPRDISDVNEGCHADVMQQRELIDMTTSPQPWLEMGHNKCRRKEHAMKMCVHIKAETCVKLWVTLREHERWSLGHDGSSQSRNKRARTTHARMWNEIA